MFTSEKYDGDIFELLELSKVGKDHWAEVRSIIKIDRRPHHSLRWYLVSSSEVCVPHYDVILARVFQQYEH